MSACAEKLLLVHALADGEVDAANAVAIEAHLASCSGCREEYERVLALRARFDAVPARYTAPAGLALSIEAMLAAESVGDDAPPPLVVASRPTKRGVLQHVVNRRWASGAITGLAAGLALTVLIPRPSEVRAGDDLVAGHIRSLMARHLTDVEASDKHVVKPWFNGKLDFAPPVPNLDTDGFPLAGGRLDFIGGRDVAALVYRRRLHVINVFVAPTANGARPAGDETKDGYTILRWTAGGLDFSAVSDLNATELRQFRQLFIARAAG